MRDYFERFTQETLKIKDLHPQTVMVTMVNGLRIWAFTKSLAKNEPATLEELQRQAKKYINIKETIKLKVEEEQ